jgi:hypothetical protein
MPRAQLHRHHHHHQQQQTMLGLCLQIQLQAQLGVAWLRRRRQANKRGQQELDVHRPHLAAKHRSMPPA